MTALDATTPAGRALRPWQDPTLPVAARVDALLAEMTLEEKVGQLGSRWVGNAMRAQEDKPEPAIDPDAGGTQNVAPMQDVFAASQAVPFEEAVRDGLGHLTRVFGSGPVSAQEGAAEVVRLQRTIVERSRLGVPAIVHEECLTGFTAYRATVYPAAIAWGATFDPDLVERMAAAIGRDMRAVGAHQGLSPVLDVVRDYRWGRVEETMGEDPHLVSTLGAAYVRGLERAGIIATLKHFAGYSASRAARNHGPVSMGRRELMDMILPPFEAAITHGGARSVMNSYSDVDGVPAVADSWLLTDLLRDEWGFTGTVVSDYWSVPFLASMHQVAADVAEAGALALAAGIDVELPDTIGFGEGLVERVRRGELPESLVDRAARRLLTQKVELGLLDPDWTPEGSVTGAATVDLDSRANRALALEMAERSVILLDAGSALPLLGEGRSAAGPDRRRRPLRGRPAHLHGLLRLPQPRAAPPPRARAGHRGAQRPRRAAHGAAGQRHRARARLRRARRGPLRLRRRGGRRAGVGPVRRRRRRPGGHVRAGHLGRGLRRRGPAAARRAGGPARRARRHRHAGRRGRRLRPPVRPGRGARRGRRAGPGVHARRGGRGGDRRRPVRPGPARRASCPCRSLSGPGGQPGTYLQPPLGANSKGISNLDPTPLFPFGHGTSYTTFEVDDLRISDTEVPTDGEFTASVRVRNTGGRAGEEVVQLYLHDVLAQVTRPVKQLTGFARVRLAPGESADVRFHVHADRTAFTGRDLRRIVEPGDVEVLVGTSAGDLPCQGVVRLTGPTRAVGHDRRLITPVDVSPAARGRATGGRRCRSVLGAPHWRPSPHRPGCRSRRSPRCSTAAATWRRRPARWCSRCCSGTTTSRRRRAARRP